MTTNILSNILSNFLLDFLSVKQNAKQNLRKEKKRKKAPTYIMECIPNGIGETAAANVWPFENDI